MSNTEINYFSSIYVERLYRKVASSMNFSDYSQQTFPYEKTFAKGPTDISLPDSFSLTGGPEQDYINCIKLYEALERLTEVEASDERLWVYLSHVRFWNYMKERWPINLEDESPKTLSRIRSRYFLRRLNLESLTRNGISRLWWYAHITRDVRRSNRYELLQVMLKRQDLVVQLTERALGTNKKIRFGILEFMKENPEISNNEKLSRELFKTVNLLGGTKLLPCLDVEEVKVVLEKAKSILLITSK